MTSPAAPQPIRVMLVDDHQTMLWGLDKLIEGERPHMEVVGTARSCEEALEKAGPLAPDVILLDLDLNGQSSLDIMAELLANNSAKILILSGEREQSILDSAIHRGARGILRKDASAEHVLKAIRTTHEGELWIDRETMSRVFSEFLKPRSARLDPDKVKQATLTTRERKVIDVVVQGRGALNKALAERLFISEHTLRNHLSSIYHKLGVSNRLELYVYAVKHQLDSSAGLAGTSE